MADDEVSRDPGDSVDVAAVWSELARNVSVGPASAWLRATTALTVHGSTLLVAVPNEFTRERIESRLRTAVESELSKLFGRTMSIAVTIDKNLAVSAESADNFVDDDEWLDTDQLHLAEPAKRESNVRTLTSPAAKQRPDDTEIRLNPKYTFDSFVIGSSNRFAHAAAIAVAETPGNSYNPLMIYGDSGLGKTHLLHAVGHYVTQYYPRLKVKYVSTEELTNDFINAISDNRTAQFRHTYRDVDVLLVDDIQFLESKIQTQEEFFHTFNTLHNSQKQIVLTSDRHPKSLEALEPRLRSRFEWGLLTDIQPPDLETRIAILRKKAFAERLSVPFEVLEFIASKIKSNIRELEGALIRVTAFASLNKQEVNLDLAASVLRDLMPEGSEIAILPSTILSQTARFFGFSVEDFRGTSRTHGLVTARQVSMYLCRELTDLSLPKIGQLFGGRDHTTVMHADRKIRQLLAEDRNVYNQVAELTNIIRNHTDSRK